MKSREEMTEILEAFDLTQSFRDAAEMDGCSHHTVAAWVARRDAGELPVPVEPTRGERMTDPFLAKIEEWVERSQGRIRADVVADKLRPLGFGGSERTLLAVHLGRVLGRHRLRQRRDRRFSAVRPPLYARTVMYIPVSKIL
ncbi:MAG: hypothetical protein M3256_27325 [Actinomycetota bacterium]|nr:hypothetical protein [Actinomycetota bacterium]